MIKYEFDFFGRWEVTKDIGWNHPSSYWYTDYKYNLMMWSIVIRTYEQLVML